MNFERLFAYDDWANRAEMGHLRSLPAPPARAVAILAHIAGTEWLWLGRLRRQTGVVVWPDWGLDRCAEEFARLYAEWKAFLPTLDRDAGVGYLNSKRERWSSRAEDIVMHVILHGAYHRGQIATLVRGAGETPAYTDFIHCVRQGWVT